MSKDFLDFDRMGLEEINGVFERFNAIIPKELVEQNAMGVMFAKNKKFFAKNLNILYSKAMMHVAGTDKPFLPVPEKSEGKISFGRYVQGEMQLSECLVDLDDMIHSAVVSAPNKGKTTILASLASQINSLNDEREKKICTIIVDRRKDFRGLDFPVLTKDYLKINFFDPPPGCDYTRWLSDMAEFLMHRWQFYLRSRNFFLDTVHNLYESRQKPPTLLEVYEALDTKITTDKKMSSRNYETAETNLDRIKNAITEFGRCVATRRTMPLHEFIDNGIPLVIEIDVSTDNFVVLFGWLLLYIYRYRKSNNMRGNVSEGGTVIICDEAYLLWQNETMYSESRRELGADLIDTSAMSLRDYRVALIAASQKSLNSDYMTATNLKLVGYLGEYEDSKYLASSLGDPSLVDVIPRLKKGQFIIKKGEQKPALIETNDFERKQVDDKTLESRMQPIVEYIEEYCLDGETEIQKEEKQQRVTLSADAKRLIQDILESPESTISVRYFRLNLKGEKAQHVVEEVIKSGYAGLVVEALESAKAAKYLVLTQQAIDWLRSQGKSVDHIQHIGRVSPLHALYQTILQSYLVKLGWTVQHDIAVKEKFVDLLASKDGKKIVYEIAISGAVDASRVSSALSEDDIKEYVFLCKDLAIMSSIRSQLGYLQSPKIRYLVANQFVMNLKKSVLDYYRYSKENIRNTEKESNSGTSSREEEENRR